MGSEKKEKSKFHAIRIVSLNPVNSYSENNAVLQKLKKSQGEQK